MATGPTAAHVIPAADRYAVARWRELLSDDIPWWARSPGIGFRLRLHELYQLAQAREEGSIASRPVDLLRNEAVEVMLKAPYCRQRFPGLSEYVQRLLRTGRDAGRDPFLPGGKAATAVQAGLDLLARADLVPQIVRDLALRVDEAKDAEAVEGIDELVELLDAELAFDGFSTAWRRAACVEVGTILDSGRSPHDAFNAVIQRYDDDQPRPFQAVVPITAISRPAHMPEIGLTELSADDAEDMIREEWDHEALLADVSFAKGAIHFAVVVEDGSGARDLDGAAEIVRDWLSRRIDLWRLQGGRVAISDTMLVYEPERNQAVTAPTEMPLRLMPAGLGGLEADLDRQSLQAPPGRAGAGRLPDVFVQLAQARTASPSAALSDLWMVVEAMFAGIAEDPRHEAGNVLAGIARWSAVSARLSWLADRVDGTPVAGAYSSAVGTRTEWVAGVLDDRREELLEDLRGRDPLGWRRVSEVLAWKEGGLSSELERAQEGIERVAARAYLVRNFVVHQARPSRAPAITVTLPIFAALVQMAMTFVTRFAKAARPPLSTATLAAMESIQLAHDFSGEPLPALQLLAQRVERFAPARVI